MTKHNLFLLFIFLTFISCFFSDYESKLVKSPSGKYQIKATVNRTDKQNSNFAEVYIHLFDSNGKLKEIKTGAGDANKWAFGWTKKGDTIILYSSDIGNKSWAINKNTPIEVKMDKNLNERAESLYMQKYQ